MKLILRFMLVLFLTGCVSEFAKFGGGSLGAVANTELRCSGETIKQEMDTLSNTTFKIPAYLSKDTAKWGEWGYDFLTYWNLKIDGRMYMISYSHASIATSIAIRSYFNEKKKKWIYAVDMNSSEKERAEKAMAILLEDIPKCY